MANMLERRNVVVEAYGENGQYVGKKKCSS